MFRSACAFNTVALHALHTSKTSFAGALSVAGIAANPCKRCISSSIGARMQEPDASTSTAAAASEAITIHSENSSPTEAAQGKKKRKTRALQTSIEGYMDSKKYLYVTDLVGPTWCEYSYQYNIMGMSSLPISERPETITLPSGKEIRPNADLTQKREKIIQKGNQIHAKLEREVHPDKITVQTQSEEDRWALRMLKLIVGLRSLIDRGCVRELPVFGWAEQYLVTGIIDEIDKRPLLKKRQVEATVICDAQSNAQSRDDQSKLPFAEAASTSSNVELTPSKKTWSSQEEWKAHQRRVDSAKKAATKSKAKTKSPKKPKSGEGNATSDPKQHGLQSFFGPSKAKAEKEGDGEPPGAGALAAQAQDTATAVAALRGYFLSDTKTRTFDSLPRISEQRGARLQTMMYKRMLDGLCQGAVERAVQHQEGNADKSVTTPLNHTAVGIRGDPDATPLDFTSFFGKLNLSPHQELSQAFRDDAQELLDELDLSHLPTDVAQTIAAATADADNARKLSLSDLVHVVDEHLIELLIKAQRESSVPETKATDEEIKQHIMSHHRHDASAIQNDLSLIYRLQQRKQKSKAKRKARVGTNGSTLDVENLPEIQAMIHKSLEGQAELGLSTQEEDGKGFEALSLPSSPPRKTGSPRRSRRLAGTAASQVQTPLATTSTPLPTIDARTPTLSLSPPPATPPRIIGQVTFSSLPFHLTSHVRSILEFWHGKRDPIGVGENETWKCRACEWFEGCEWRHDKGEEKRLWAAQKRNERLVKETQGEDASTARSTQWVPIEYLDHPDPRHDDGDQQDEYEESLWAHFDLDDHSALPSSQPADHTPSAPSLNVQEQDWVEMQANQAAGRSS